MKKMIIGTIIGIAATLVIGGISIWLYTKIFMIVPDKTEVTNENGEEIEKKVEFRGVSEQEWEKKIAKYEVCDEQMVDCYYEDDEFIGVVNNENNEIVAHYEFDEKTGYALEIFSGNRVDLIKGEIIERNCLGGTQIELEDNQILAIGYVKDTNLNEFIKKNFVSEVVYDNLVTLDYRKEESRISGSGNIFVLIPKTSDVEIEIYKAYITEEGELKLLDQWGETLNEGFILLQEYLAESTRPEFCFKVKYHGTEEIIPLVFSGEDDKLDLSGHEEIVQDISVY